MANWNRKYRSYLLELPPEEDDEKIGDRIGQLRDALGLTQAQFIKKVAPSGEIKRGALANWECGKGIKLENLRKIAARTNCSFEWLAMGRGVAFPAQGLDDAVGQLPQEDQLEITRRVLAIVRRRLEKYMM